MKRVEEVKNAKKHLLGLVLIVSILMASVLTVHAEEDVAMRLMISQTFHATGSTVTNADGIFEYKLTAMTEEPSLSNDSMQEGYQFYLMGNQSKEIVPMTYSNAGVYEYRLEMETSSEKKGYTYDREVYFITVYIKETENNGLIAEVIAKNTAGDKVGNLHFEHSYQPVASEPSIMVDPPVKKTVSGNPSSEGTFLFALTAENKNQPMPPGSIDGKLFMTIRGEGEEDFGVWSYTSTGVYRYFITEENVGEEGYTYDKTVYTITDVVENNNGELMVTRKITNNDKKQVDLCTFNNHYSESGSGREKGSKALETGDAANIAFWAIIFTIGAVAIFILKKDKTPTSTGGE